MRDKSTGRRTWYSIDMVQHRGPDGQQHFYSSKPPLLPTIYAGIYWIVRQTTGYSLLNQPFQVAQIMLVLVNLLPTIALWWLMIHWCKQRTLDPLSFSVMIVLATLGTFLSTFVVTLNNHTPAAVAIAFSMLSLEKIAVERDLRYRWFILAGLMTSFGTANEMPALCWLVIAGAILSLLDIRKTLMCFVPALLPVTVGFFATNYLAHGTWRPAYSQRAVGSIIGISDTHISNSDVGQVDPRIAVDFLRAHGFELSDQALIRKARREGIWELWDEQSQWRIALRQDGKNQLGFYHWGDWYDYPGSYWVDGKKKGVDKGEPSRLLYTFHCLTGHHGIFSLTPIWLLSLAGVYFLMHQTKSGIGAGEKERNNEPMIALAILVTSLVVIAFYLSRPLEDRNYGGVCSGLRWAFWLIPLWFWLALRGFCCKPSRWARVLIVALLSISLFSANYPWKNPWSSPWITQLIPLQDQEY